MQRVIFPEHLPDETLFSLLTRICRLNGISDFRDFASRFFGRPVAASFVDAQIDFPEFCRRTNKAYGESGTVLDQLTALDAQVRIGELSSSFLEEMETGARKLSLGELAFHDATELSYCPECRRQDISNYGFSYWHRQHQLPIVHYCALHEVQLERVKIKRMRLHQAFPIPSDFGPHLRNFPQKCFIEAKELWLGVAKMVCALFDAKTKFDVEIFEVTLLSELRARKLMTPAGAIRMEEILSFFSDSFTGFGTSVQDTEGRKILGQVIRGLTSPASGVVFGRIVLCYGLFGNWQAFEKKCKWAQVFGVSQKPPMSPKKDISTVQELASFHRKVCVDYRYEHPGCSRLDFTKANYRSFRWLLHNDRGWLDKQLPIPPVNMKQFELFGVVPE